MWIKRKTYITMLSDIKALTALLETKKYEQEHFLQGHVQARGLIAELTQAKSGLIALAKARKVQLLELKVDPIGLDDIAEIQQEVVGVHLENISRRVAVLEQLINPTEDSADD
tara:strand:- start:1640 stop:1978 length:339 start_codon:yes stop_codon:yes gene_type:complete